MPIRVERESIKLLIICVIGHDTEELPGFLGGVVRIQCAAFYLQPAQARAGSRLDLFS